MLCRLATAIVRSIQHSTGCHMPLLLPCHPNGNAPEPQLNHTCTPNPNDICQLLCSQTIARMELPETPVPSFAFRPNLKAGMSAQLTSLELASKVHQSPRGDALIVRAVVLESKKPERQLAMATPLFIEVPLVGKQQYDDLDEVIARWVAGHMCVCLA